MNKKKPIIITAIVVIVCIIASIFVANKYINQKPIESTTQAQSTSSKAIINTTSTDKQATISKQATATAITQTTTIIEKTTSTTKADTKATAVTTSKPAIKTTASTTKSTTTKSTTKATISVDLTQNSTVAPTTSNNSEICYVTIECKEILGKINKLSPGHAKYVPKNGYLLSNYPVSISSGDTAYDALKKSCNDNGIKLTAQTTSYGTYVSGINNLDEKDCGSQSGWLYSVNSSYPNVSCGKLEINPNDKITFHYTC